MQNSPTIFFTVTNDLVHDQRMIRICTTLQNAGYTVILIGREQRNSPNLVPQPYRQVRLKLWFESGKLFYLEYNLRLLLYLIFQRFAGICSIDLDTAVPGILVCKLRRKIHFFDAHELFPQVPEVIRRPRIQKVWQRVERWVFARTDVAYTVGHALSNYFKETYRREVTVVRNMPLPRTENLPFWPEQLPQYLQDQPFLLYQGALNEGRGLEVLISAMSNIDIPLVLVGDGDITQKLKQLTAQLHLNHIFFAGHVLPKHLPAIAKYAWLGINVSENVGLSYYLSLNNKFFDYVQDQLPSIINPFPEYLSLLQEFEVGIACEADANQIVTAIQQLHSDSELYNQLKQNCIHAAKRWNWNEEKIHLLNMYNHYLSLS